MAKKQTELAVAESAPETALATIPQDLLDAQGAGTENVEAGYMRPPRLAICQTGSAQFKRNNPKHIDGITDGDLFNNLSNEIYPRPLKFVVLMRLKTNYMQFKPGELGVVLDYDVPAGDPRTLPTLDERGKWKEKPVATQFDNYLVLLPDTFEVMSLSFKATGLTASKFLDNMLRYPMMINGARIPKPSAWFRQFSLDTTDKDGKGNSWKTPVVTSAGVVPEELRLLAASLYDQYKNLKDKKIKDVIDHADEVDADAPDSNSIPF